MLVRLCTISSFTLLVAVSAGCSFYRSAPPCYEDSHCSNSDYYCEEETQTCRLLSSRPSSQSASFEDDVQSDSGSISGQDAGSVVGKDAGHVAGDGGMQPVDSGFEPSDAGAGSGGSDGGDAGSGQFSDGGVLDGGALPLDAGPFHLDGGTDVQPPLNVDGGGPDAGVPPHDSGVEIFMDSGLVDEDGGFVSPGCLLDSYAFTLPIYVQYNGQSFNSYALSFFLNTEALIEDGKLQQDCEDIRIVDSSGNELPSFVETGCGEQSTKIWVSVDLPSSLTTQTPFLYVQYGNVDASSQDDRDEIFLLYETFDDQSSFDDWEWLTDDYQMGHDEGAFAALVLFGDPPVLTAAMTAALASCSSSPFDGVEAYGRRDLNLPNATYCIDVRARSDVTDFLWNSTAQMRTIIYTDGTKHVDDATTCSSMGCDEEGDWIDYALKVSSSIGHLRLGGRASDCTYGVTFFDSATVRRCMNDDTNLQVMVSNDDEENCLDQDSDD